MVALAVFASLVEVNRVDYNGGEFAIRRPDRI